jgi:hypothetical protein
MKFEQKIQIDYNDQDWIGYYLPKRFFLLFNIFYIFLFIANFQV